MILRNRPHYLINANFIGRVYLDPYFNVPLIISEDFDLEIQNNKTLIFILRDDSLIPKVKNLERIKISGRPSVYILKNNLSY